MEKITKADKVKNHLLKHKSINSWQAIKLYKVTRLSAIIFNLRKKGWKISSSTTVNKDGEPCAVYKLLVPPKI